MSMLTVLRKKWVLGVVLSVLLIGGMSLVMFAPEEEIPPVEEEQLPELQLKRVQDLRDRGVVTTAVGIVQAARDVEIKAESSGQVVYAPVDQGYEVQSGRVMLELDSRLVDAQVQKAQADVQAQQATLSKLRAGDRSEDVEILQQRLIAEQQRYQEMKRGARTEEVELTTTQLQNAKKVLVDRQRDVANALQKATADVQSQWINYRSAVFSASATLDRILSQNVQSFIFPFRQPEGQSCQPQLRFQVTRDLLERCSGVLDLLDRFTDLRENLRYEEVAAGNSLVNELYQTQLQELDYLRALLREILYVLNSNTSIMERDSFQSLSEEEINALKSTVTTAQADLERVATDIALRWEQLQVQISASRSAVDSAETAITAAQNEIARLEQELKLRQVSATDEQLKIQEAQIRQLELQLQVAQNGARSEDLQIQQAALNRARGELQTALTNRDKASIRSPFAGVVTFFPFEEGDYINAGEVVARLADRSQMEVKTFITEKEVGLIREGTFVDLQGRESLGIVTDISPVLNDLTKKIEVTVTLTDAFDQLVLGQTVWVNFQYDTPAEAIRLPLTALRVVQDEASVLTVIDGVVTAVPVTVGTVYEETIVVQDLDPELPIIADVAGIEPGDEVRAELPEPLPEESDEGPSELQST